MHSTKQIFDYENKQWGSNPIENLYTDLQGLQLKFLLKDLANLKPPKDFSVLDLGCGGGNIAGFLKKQFPSWSISGVDVSKNALKKAKAKFSDIHFITSNAEKISLPSESLDMITSFDSLEHFDNPNAVLTEIHRLLKNKGIFYLGVPLEKQFPSLYWILYKLGWRGKQHFSGHVNFFTDSSVIRLVENNGFKLHSKRFSFHLIFSLFDIGYYFLQKLIGKPFAFETTVADMQGGWNKSLLSIIKDLIAVTGYIESTIFESFPSGKGHYLFIKTSSLSANDFFSDHPPLTVAEEIQQKYGMRFVLQPRDIEIKTDLEKLNYKEARHILDFGCANGIWLERILKETQSQGYGVDIADKLIQYANKRPNKKGVYYNSSEAWPLKKNSVDLCYSFDTFEHIKNPFPQIQTIHNTLRKGGKIYFYTINPDNKYTLDWLFEKFGSDFMYKRADHKKEMFIAPVKLKLMLNKSGFKNINYKLYDGPINLIWRVFAYSSLNVVEKLLRMTNLFALYKYYIYILDVVFRLFYPLSMKLDSIFIRRGHSNGYFIWGEK